MRIVKNAAEHQGLATELSLGQDVLGAPIHECLLPLQDTSTTGLILAK